MWLATASRSAVAQRPRLQSGHLGEHRVVEAPAGGEHAHELLRVAPSFSIRSASAAARLGGTAPRPSMPGGEELLREQRIALAARVQAVDQRGVGRASRGCSRAARASSSRVKPPRSIRSARTRSSSASSGRSGWRRCSSSGPVRGDDEQRLVAERGGEEAQEGARGGVGPVQVLDHEQHQRLLAREPVEHREQRLEDARLLARAARPLARAAASPGSSVASSASMSARQRGRARDRASRTSGRSARDERRVGQLALAELDAVAAQHARPVGRRARLQLGDEPASCRRPTRRPRTPAKAGPRRRRRAPPRAGRARASGPTRRVEVTPVAMTRRIAGRRGQAAARGRRCSAACTIAQDLGDAVGDDQALRVRGRRCCPCCDHRLEQPVDEAGPVGRAEQHDREVADLARLAQRRGLEQLVERAEAAREDDERARVAHEHHLAREEVVEVEAEVDVRVLELLVRQLDVEPDRRRRPRRARRGCPPP